MAKKKKQRISYVLPLASRPGGHRLGINGLSIDHERNIFYTGGRDGVICAWDLDLAAKHEEQQSSLPPKRTTASFRREVQAHTNWVNDLVLVKNNLALVSASSDSSVKLWRPHSHDTHAAYSIGSHSDYVKCLTTPDQSADWVASGGLDARVCLWDLAGKGQTLEINVKKSTSTDKGSVYALKARGSVIASGGPDAVVRLWDVNTGKSITKLVGHTDIIRDILINDDHDTVLTASSDQTIKVWSIAAGRCMHTLTMHNDSVWRLYSDDPSLSIFYSGDKSGLVAKTDTRHADDIDDGISVAICQEHDGITRLAITEDSVWTATSSSSVNRWADVDTELEIETPPPSPKYDRRPSQLSRSHHSPSPPESPPPATNGVNNLKAKRIPHNSVLRMTITASHPGRKMHSLPNQSVTNLRKPSEAIIESDLQFIVPIRGHPEETIEGQHGLVKHVMLNDKKRVLTLDTAGEVVLWDLLKCVPIQAFGRKHLDEVAPDVNTRESVANWCTVDTKTGKLTVMLEEAYAFDAEVYADETEFAGKIEFREDQRINLGKWVLRNLFTSLLDEEIKRDEVYRKTIAKPTGLVRENAPTGLQLPLTSNGAAMESPGSVTTPKATNGVRPPPTPGLNIGLATPLPVPQPGSATKQLSNVLPTTLEEGTELDKTSSRNSKGSAEPGSNDYFSHPPTQTPTTPSAVPNPTPAIEGNDMKPVPPTPGGTTAPDAVPTSPTDDKKKKSGIFGKSFNMKMSFPNKLARTSTEVSKGPETKPEEKSEDQSDKSSEKEEAPNNERPIEDNFLGVIQKIHYAYEDASKQDPDAPLALGITASPPNETPVLKPPPHTLILIQEDNPEAGGLSDLYRGEIAELGHDADTLEKIAPAWLGDLLLRNELPNKEPVKVSFVLQPYKDSLPSIASSDGNARLNANRMLRSKKILAYVAERIEAPVGPNSPKPGDDLKPEEYMELLCHDTVIPPDMTLSTLRVHVWRTGGDLALFYRANGKKEIRRAHPADVAGKDEGMGEQVRGVGMPPLKPGGPGDESAAGTAARAATDTTSTGAVTTGTGQTEAGEAVPSNGSDATPASG